VLGVNDVELKRTMAVGAVIGYEKDHLEYRSALEGGAFSAGISPS
jgi:hypothetical protein